MGVAPKLYINTMAIKVGDQLPEVKFHVMGPNGPTWKSTADIFKGKKVVLFAVPGAFTPAVVPKQHVHGFVQNADAIRAKGIDMIALTAVDNVFAMDQWQKASGFQNKVDILADAGATFANAIDLTGDLSESGRGMRSKRYAMLVDDCVVKHLNVEEAPMSDATNSGGPATSSTPAEFMPSGALVQLFYNGLAAQYEVLQSTDPQSDRAGPTLQYAKKVLGGRLLEMIASRARRIQIGVLDGTLLSADGEFDRGFAEELRDHIAIRIDDEAKFLSQLHKDLSAYLRDGGSLASRWGQLALVGDNIVFSSKDSLGEIVSSKEFRALFESKGWAASAVHG